MKRIVICADGTWNVRDQQDETDRTRRPTNVTKTARAVLPRDTTDTDQVVCYHDGVGTGGPLDKMTGGAFGRGIEENIRTLYRFIVYNYVPGDELYLFGFSRGAFTVRTLAGFMNFAGLVEKDDDYFVPDLYACYETRQGPGTAAWMQAHRKIQGKRPAPTIRFIGVWDTVGALGAPGLLGQLLHKNKYTYHDVALNPQIENAFHALAIDERRKSFAPTLWERPEGWPGTLEQAWFPGVHCDVGGGYEKDGLANEALHWILGKARLLGLAFDARYLSYFKPCFNGTLHDSMSLKYQALGSHLRPIGQAMAHGEALHQAVHDRYKHLSEYRAKNVDEFLATHPSWPMWNSVGVVRGTPCS